MFKKILKSLSCDLIILLATYIISIIILLFDEGGIIEQNVMVAVAAATITFVLSILVKVFFEKTDNVRYFATISVPLLVIYTIGYCLLRVNKISINGLYVISIVMIILMAIVEVEDIRLRYKKETRQGIYATLSA